MKDIALSKKDKTLLIGILIVTLLVYLQSLSFDFVNWDDDIYVFNNNKVKNPSIKNIGSFFMEGNTANYHPITMLSLSLNYLLGEDNPFGYHLFNLVFHLFNIVLLYLWVHKTWPKQVYFPLFVAGVFALHPMHVESVAWISSRKDVLFFFFYFLALLAYSKYGERREKKYILITLMFYILSALSKPAAVVFPIHLLLVDYLMGRELNLRVFIEKIPFIIVSVVIGLATVLVQTDSGAVNVNAFLFIERIQLASYAVNLYLMKFIVPVHLSSFYPYPNRPFEWFVSIAPLFSLGLGALLIWFYRKNRNVIFGVLFYLVSLILVLQFVTVGSAIIAERYTYMSYIGVCIALYFILYDLIKVENVNSNRVRNIILLCLIVFSAFSLNRVKIWRNGETLWTDAIEKFPEVAGSWGGRGVYYRMEKEYSKALYDFNRAIDLNPDEAMFYSNRGNIYFDLGKDIQAFADYNNCIQLDSLDENAYANRGAIMGRQGRYKEAILDLTSAVKINPEFVNAFMNRGIIYGQLNQRQNAKKDYKTCLKIDPTKDAIWNALAIEHQYLGEFDSSLVVLNTALELKPNEGTYYFNRGISLRLLKRQKEADIDFYKAQKLGVEVNPGYYQPIN
ncbi:tetratricopeptide repeat protein [Lentimicrobium sp. S6]|uniref:tetratricopeptide repeat protein n=1 Tax=Lentimicrobium sp. S6 TaxID=2735872 RepID=UPI001556BECA|nr:tetratricopeptide repeat protein [Lentimicrobium sp. S6]NPD48176.1 tetratricopeptide repeat protein [Lentimicrobium sp. S6]